MPELPINLAELPPLHPKNQPEYRLQLDKNDKNDVPRETKTCTKSTTYTTQYAQQ
jgi:hypothetical protein